MPEEVKLSSYAPAKDYKSDYCSSADDSHPESSIYADHSDREMSRSETSSCSDESSCYKQNGHETIEIIPTRTIKTSIPKPAANPLQFVKIGPCDLYRSAQKQIQKVSEVKTPKKEVKDEVAMDWQSNLDSWKCNRRKQQEHIIERVVEVKKLELEEHDRNRKRTKTFNEMMEERTSKGRKASLPVYLEDDNDDLSDLGLSTNMKISRNESSPIPEENDEENDDQVCGADRKHNGHDGSDRAQMGNCEVTCENGVSKSKKCASSSAGLRKYGRRASATKIEEKLTELERIKNRSVSSTDLTESNKKSINLPKVNISQRKEMFEKFSDSNESNKNRRLSDEMPPVRSIKERLSSLGKTIEETTTTMTTTSTTTVTVQPIQTKSLLPVPEVSVKERLSSINRKMNEHNNTGVPIPPEKCGSRTKMSPPLEPESNDKPKEYATYETRPLCKPVEELSRREYSSSGRSSSSEDYDHVHHQTNHFHHRSLDSLQGHDSPNGFCFERVQSLEYIDCCSNYPASVLSGDTDREDSGIHTADVSSSVSQADDFDLHADTSMDVDVKAAQNATTTLISDDTKVVDKSSQNDYCFVSQEAGQGSLDDVHDDHVDVTAVFGCEDRRDNVDASLVEEEEEEEEEERGGEASVTSETNSNSPPVVAEERLPVVEPNQKLDAAIEETIELSHDQNQNAKEQLNEDDTLTSSRLNDNGVCDSDVESPVDDSWDMDCKIVEQDDNLNNVEEDDSVAEEASPASSNVKNLDSSEDAMQNFANIEDECLSGTECGVNSSQHFDYIYAMNNKFDEGNRCNFTESNQLFAFEPLSVAAEPPKEKPPPPPSIDNSDEEVTIMENSKGLRRMDSTKRIKKQLRQKRSSFLGIEGYDDDSYLEPELEAVKPPPDMTTFLQEERRLEQLLYRQSICSESDSTLGESRDSGVELDKNHNEDNLWISERACSRQDSEIYANTSITSEEEEIIKKEREILEILEMEERRNYESGSKNECNNINEKLVLKLKELENRKNDDANWNQENELSDLENRNNRPLVEPIYENCDVSLKGHTHHQMHELSGQSPNALLLQQQWAGRPLQDIGQKDMLVDPVDENHQKTRLDYRDSTSNVPEESRTVPVNHHFKQPPPVPMNKPTHFKEQPAANNKLSSPQQMSKQTLQALSAVPRSKITDSWVQTKKKPRQEAYNYQHWLIQEAEHRRITEYQERQSKESTTATTTTTTHNYMNVHPEFSEPTGLLADAVVQQQQQQSPPSNRTATYSHPPQMLPYRNQNQTYSNTNSNECKSQTKMQYCNSNNNSNSSSSSSNSSSSKPLPDSVIQTLTQRVQNRFGITDGAKQRRQRESYSNTTKQQQEKILSVSGKKKCSHCGEELGRGAAMIIESLRLFYHIDCFRCCVCCVQLGDGLMGTDVRVRNSKLHCHSCYSNDEGVKFSCV